MKTIMYCFLIMGIIGFIGNACLLFVFPITVWPFIGIVGSFMGIFGSAVGIWANKK